MAVMKQHQEDECTQSMLHVYNDNNNIVLIGNTYQLQKKIVFYYNEYLNKLNNYKNMYNEKPRR